MYVFDTSGSMAFTDFNGTQTRVSGLKAALLGVAPEKGVLEEHIRGEARNDDDPDNIGFTGLVFPGTRLSEQSTLLNINGNGEIRELSDPGTVESSLGKGRAKIQSAPASGGTPLFHTMLESARVIGNGTEDEPTALLMLSDGEDNSSNMGTNPQDKSQMYSTIDRVFPEIEMSSAIRNAQNNPNISREQMFGMILKENYPNMVVHVVDVRPGGNTGLKQMVKAVGGSGRYVVANDQAALKEFLLLLAGVCTTNVAGGP